MSFGKSSSNNNSQQQATSQQTLDPQIKQALLGNYGNAQNLASQPYQPFTGQQVAPLTDSQNQAMGGILGLGDPGAGTLGNAVDATQSVANYTPQNVQGSTYNPYTGIAALSRSASAGPAAQTGAASIDPNSVGNVSTAPVSASQIANYMNPYTSSVVDTTNSDLERARQVQRVQDQQSATADGAFGGARSGVADSLTNEAYLRTLGSQDAALNSAGFNTALSAAQNDQDLGLQAQTQNQNTAASIAGQNAGYQQQSGLANQAATNAQSQFNASNRQQTSLSNQAAQNAMGQTNLAALNTAGATNAANTLAANLANQNAGLQGAGLNLQAGSQLGSLAGQQLSQPLAALQAALGVGNQQQAQQQATDTANYTNYQNAQNWPLMVQQLVNQSLGLAGNPTLGSSQSTGTSTGSSSGFNFGLGQKS